ncbi:hypothetical protein [Abiotrophia defectiva]|uniref:hypothetical protein n=1 Tax=Abiotrophia defectiva TaxID=46125 RepID=UPI0028CFE815|nr:hypothetical protein [Abiotrophia defectiva]
MIDESKKGRQSKFNLYMTLYTVLRVLTLITGLDLMSFAFVLGFVYVGRLLAFYWLMIAWKDHDTTIFKRGYQLDLVLTSLEVGLGVLGILFFPYILWASQGLILILLIIPIIIWLVLLGAKNRFDEARAVWLHELETKRYRHQSQD